MPGSGTALLDFGAFPGASHATLAITGQTGILTSSLVEAFIFPDTTADHSADEHVVEPFAVFVPKTSIVAGTGFTIHGVNRTPLGDTLISGLWSIAWVWN